MKTVVVTKGWSMKVVYDNIIIRRHSTMKTVVVTNGWSMESCLKSFEIV